MDMLKIPRDGFSLRSLLLLLLLLVATLASVISPVSAQDLGLETGDDSSNESTRVLNRRSKIVLPNVQDEAANGNDDRESGIKKNAVVELSEEGGLGLFDAFFASLSMIIVSEIGDETFIIAALMAMRHPKSIVLSGALTALIVMTVLSTGLGRIVPNLISRKHTNSAATVLYAFFGLRLLYIAWRSDSKASQKKEMEEVEEKLETAGSMLMALMVGSLLATHKNAVGVAVGATLGHTICTSIAVVGGSMLASKISQGTVATIGGLLFLCFSLSSYFYPPL